MNDSTIAFRAKERLGKFPGKVFAHFSKPRKKFLPMHPEKELHMIMVKGFGDDPMMLLTSLPVNGSFESMWRIVEGYLTRWRIEETIRFVKQAYGFENIRVLSYRGIRNMASIVLATTYFASTWLGRHVKREVLADKCPTK